MPSARRKIQTLQGEINGVLKSRVNDPGMQAGLAGSLKKYLVLGPAGEVQISSLAVDAKGIVVSFKLAGQQ